jgi:hypothetical protein
MPVPNLVRGAGVLGLSQQRSEGAGPRKRGGTMTTYRWLQRAPVVVAAAALGVLVSAGPSVAAPTSQLPDADLFCGPGYEYQVDGFVALPEAASQWVDDPVLGGHYLVLDVAHYLAQGLLYAPVTDLSAVELLRSKTYGSRDGLAADQVVECQVVSRFAESDVTVVAPITMVRVP